MTQSWDEITTAAKENRHELVLSGTEISKRISKSGLDKNLFALNLNFLNISDTCLSEIPDEISKLTNLQQLLFFSNKITKIPKAVEKLSKLKLLDVSRNAIYDIEVDFNLLSQLTSINISQNKLESFPKIGGDSKLTVLDLSDNKINSFPDVCEAVHLFEIKFNSNEITEIPHEIGHLTSLKSLDLSDNKITAVPGELSDITKLKEINLKGNPVADRRLLKLIDQCRPKQVLDYVKQHGARKGNESGDKGKSKGKKGKGQSRKDSHHEEENNENDNDCKYNIIVAKEETADIITNVTVKQTEASRTIRPHILCCIVTGLKFTTNSFRKFIQMQTRLHDTVCEKRTACTLATHDLKKIVMKASEESQVNELIIDAKTPTELKMIPLGATKVCSGKQLFEKLRAKAENIRKEKKRNFYSGIHRYLYMLEGKSHYPCLLDAQGQVISFPPITNSDITRMSSESTSMLIEATSSTSQNVCKKALDQILLEVLTLGITENDGSVTVHRVRITDSQGNLRAVYPSRADLKFEDAQSVKIIRE